MSNNKAAEYKKRHMKELSVQSQNNADRLGNAEKMTLAVAQRLFAMEQRFTGMQRRLDKTEATARYADYRSSAAVTLLKQAGIFSEEALLAEIETLQIRDFEHNSKIDDERNSLEDAGQGPAEVGQHAIFVLKLMKEGKELLAERVVRAKSQLGNEKDAANMIPGVLDAIVGMQVGESKLIPMDLSGQTDQAEITLLGLRKEKPAPAPEQTSGDETQAQE